MVELAMTEADEITARANAAAEGSWSAACQAADRLQARHERLLAELEAREKEMESEHRGLMRGAHQQIEAMTRQAEQRRHDLDEKAAAVRAGAESDCRLAMAARRAEAVREVAELRAAAGAEAEHAIRAAHEQADALVGNARREVARLAERRDKLAAALYTTKRLLEGGEPMLARLPDEAGELVGHLAADGVTGHPAPADAVALQPRTHSTASSASRSQPALRPNSFRAGS
ncbi:MAG TPA: hypothetical protein VH969_23770 [Actinophytocola sp.]|uniref:hypothetical protein n=1 Tax=Actinophytocola sp. TaxID=1872138 RepID=UPI002F93882B